MLGLNSLSPKPKQTSDKCVHHCTSYNDSYYAVETMVETIQGIGKDKPLYEALELVFAVGELQGLRQGLRAPSFRTLEQLALIFTT